MECESTNGHVKLTGGVGGLDKYSQQKKQKGQDLKSEKKNWQCDPANKTSNQVQKEEEREVQNTREEVKSWPGDQALMMRGGKIRPGERKKE